MQKPFHYNRRLKCHFTVNNISALFSLELPRWQLQKILEGLFTGRGNKVIPNPRKHGCYICWILKENQISILLCPHVNSPPPWFLSMGSSQYSMKFHSGILAQNHHKCDWANILSQHGWTQVLKIGALHWNIRFCIHARKSRHPLGAMQSQLVASYILAINWRFRQTAH